VFSVAIHKKYLFRLVRVRVSAGKALAGFPVVFLKMAGALQVAKKVPQQHTRTQSWS
jgi:hypothetical protein